MKKVVVAIIIILFTLCIPSYIKASTYPWDDYPSKPGRKYEYQQSK